MSLEEESLNNNNNNTTSNNDDQDYCVEDLNLIIKRPIYSQKKFESEFNIRNESKNITKNTKRSRRYLHRFKRILKYYHPKKLLDIFTIVNLVSEYNFKKYLIGDIISGLTIGVLHIPTSLAYGAVTSLNPIHGLYSTFFPSLFYVLFCTSKHLSVGTFAIISFMAYSTIIRVESNYVDYAPVVNNSLPSNGTINDSDEDDPRLMYAKIRVATALTFWCGVVQILMAVFRFGGITKYMSQPLLRGFTTGATYHILISQLPFVFGIAIKSSRDAPRFFKIFKTIISVVQNIASTNLAAFIISIGSIILLVGIKLGVNDRYKVQLKNIPIPIELIVMIGGIIITYFGQLHQKFHLPIVGEIPTGFPTPSVPDVFMFEVIPDAIIISLVTFATSISIADLYARKHKYKLDSNKEIFAMGVGNFASSFLKCIPSAGTLARTVVQEESGGNTQVVTILADLVVFLVMFYIAPLLEQLPKACLGTIIISALIHLLRQTRDIVYYWKLDKIDFGTWMTTFLACLFLDIDYGLLVGILALLFLNTFRLQNIKLIELGQVKDYELHLDIKEYETQEHENIKIISTTHSLFYVNADAFRHQFIHICPLKETIEEKTICQNCAENYLCCCGYGRSSSIDMTKSQIKNINNNSDANNIDLVSNQNENLNDASSISSSNDDHKKYYDVIILDCTLIQFIDETGVKCLNDLIKDYTKENVKFLLTNCNRNVIEFFKRMDCYKDKLENIIYLTVKDALVASTCKKEI